MSCRETCKTFNSKPDFGIAEGVWVAVFFAMFSHWFPLGFPPGTSEPGCWSQPVALQTMACMWCWAVSTGEEWMKGIYILIWTSWNVLNMRNHCPALKVTHTWNNSIFFSFFKIKTVTESLEFAYIYSWVMADEQYLKPIKGLILCWSFNSNPWALFIKLPGTRSCP